MAKIAKNAMTDELLYKLSVAQFISLLVLIPLSIVSREAEPHLSAQRW